MYWMPAAARAVSSCPSHNYAPDWLITGIEAAPAPFAFSRWRGRFTHNLSLLRADFWQHPLAGYDVVYAFLSPVPMPELWAKARREMAPGSLLISNSFAIPNVNPEKNPRHGRPP